MNLILLDEKDFIGPGEVSIAGRRLSHILEVHRARPGDTLRVGIEGGRIGDGTVTAIDDQALRMEVSLNEDPPSPLSVTVILALPRPKVLRRVIRTLTIMGVKKIFLLNAWRVEKGYWQSPVLDGENLRSEVLRGLEQARDTIPPSLSLRPRFRPFAEDELPALAEGTLSLVAHPGSHEECPRNVEHPVTLAIGPEGGFIPYEIGLFKAAGFRPVRLGERIFNVEAAVPALLSRLF